MLTNASSWTRWMRAAVLVCALFAACALVAVVSSAEFVASADASDIPTPVSRVVGPRGATGVIRRSDRRQDRRLEEDLEDLQDLNNAVDRDRGGVHTRGRGAAGGRPGQRR